MDEREGKSPESNSPQSEDEDYQEAARSTADYAKYSPPQKERSPIWRKLGIGLAILIVIAVLGAGGYWFAKNHKSTKTPTQSSQASQTNSVDAGTKITSATKHHDSTNFNLGFDYPADWTVTDSGNGQLTVRSPAVSVKDSDGQTVNVRISLNIRDKTQKLSEFDTGNAIAALDSEKVAYTKPTQTQRANTYLSFLMYASSTRGFDGIYITGDSGYKKAQAIPKVDIQKIEPIISLTFAKCTDSTCSGSMTALSVSTDNWDDQNFSQPLKAMLQSFSIT
ncbi:MAG TPA: hypothetical protein VLE51_03920 [Candidatus Saccharimonadales bacterium]|nr:hypothetical protein [Candidatus Saccharimonadales bacterium]HSX27496.1 hypothetical protein [Patescibacteria group bacterium]